MEAEWKVSFIGSWVYWALSMSSFLTAVLAFMLWTLLPLCNTVFNFWNEEIKSTNLSSSLGSASTSESMWYKLVLYREENVAVMLTAAAYAFVATFVTSVAPPSHPAMRYLGAALAILSPTVLLASLAFVPVKQNIGATNVVPIVLCLLYGVAHIFGDDHPIRRYFASYHKRELPSVIVA